MILVSWPGIKPVTPAMEALSSNPWTTRESPNPLILSASVQVSIQSSGGGDKEGLLSNSPDGKQAVGLVLNE